MTNLYIDFDGVIVNSIDVTYEMFDKLLADIDAEIASFLLKIDVRQEIKPPRPTKAQKLNANDGKEKVKAKPQVNKNKIGRNDPCPCGSGKKYKNCCGKWL